MKKRSIPRVPPSADADTHAMLDAMKENMEVIIGHRGGKITALPVTASAADVIAKVNEIIARMQG